MAIIGIPSACWKQYGETIESWYIQNYGSKNNARKDAGYAKEAVIFLTHDKLKNPRIVSNVVRNLMKNKGATTFGTETCRLWVLNTIESFMRRCAKGETKTHECYSDRQCWEKMGNKDWRCRENTCVPYKYEESGDYETCENPIYAALHPSECAKQESGFTKLIIAVVGGIILIAILLGSLGYSGLGGAAASHLEKGEEE
jgi:hypothetical protein